MFTDPRPHEQLVTRHAGPQFHPSGIAQALSHVLGEADSTDTRVPLAPAQEITANGFASEFLSLAAQQDVSHRLTC